MNHYCSTRVIPGGSGVDGLTNYQMKQLLKDNGLPISGTRLELCERLLEYGLVEPGHHVRFIETTPPIYRPTKKTPIKLPALSPKSPAPILKPVSPRAPTVPRTVPRKVPQTARTPTAPRIPRSPPTSRFSRTPPVARIPRSPVAPRSPMAPRVSSPKVKLQRATKKIPQCSPRVQYGNADVNGLSVYDMKTILQKNGLSPWGTREKLCERISANKLPLDPNAEPIFTGYSSRVIRGSLGLNGLTTYEMKAILRNHALSPWGSRMVLAQRISDYNLQIS